MNENTIKEKLLKLVFEMTASASFGARCAEIMDISEQDLVYIFLYAKNIIGVNNEI